MISYVPNYYLFLDWSRTGRIHTNSYPHCFNTLTTSATSKTDRLVQVDNIFISLCLPSFMNAGNSYSVQISSIFLPSVSYCLFLYSSFYSALTQVNRLSWGHWKPYSSQSWLNYFALSKLQIDSSPFGTNSAPTFLISTFLHSEKMCSSSAAQCPECPVQHTFLSNFQKSHGTKNEW